MRRMSFALAAAAFAAVVSSTAAEAQSRTQVGVLDCRGGRTVGMILGSTTTLGCIFRSGRRVENYVATVNRLGLDVGITENVALAWTVLRRRNVSAAATCPATTRAREPVRRSASAAAPIS